MKNFLLQFFTWWNGQTLATRFNTWRTGRRVGSDEQGNVYYEGGKNIDGYPRRWVIYNGESEASRVPSGWHGWLHYRTDTPPSDESYQPKAWELAHEANKTGTAGAYHPRGSMQRPEAKPQIRGDYDAWTPGN